MSCVYRGIEVQEHEDGKILVRVTGPNVKYLDGPRGRWRKSTWWMFNPDGTPLVNFDNTYAEWGWGIYERNFRVILDEVDEVSACAREELDPEARLNKRILQLESEVRQLKAKRK